MNQMDLIQLILDYASQQVESMKSTLDFFKEYSREADREIRRLKDEIKQLKTQLNQQKGEMK